ncbi:CPBP family intramembrane metalloprotease [Aquimarina sp. TRL1]|uniref:CPBP family intramembrane glutamic endopeptidase n=1 Tax=Aquimarina sp. (strain TRL1) TaxID=2736252 RepID=UPI00158C5CFD|nr:CPBP family intramembrane glutamic endopeptidase [Aquimarina sp. TRL1]QKX07152.1 CPBP family intramembrane metalloprotease [Aquimarina sp. TRL1]
MNSLRFIALELFVLFVLLPVSFLITYPFVIKAGVTLLAFGYVLWGIKKRKVFKKKEEWRNTGFFWRDTLFKFLIIAIITTVYVYLVAPQHLFFIPLKKTGLWLIILLVYTFLSVLPQEIIYRTFFFERYASLVDNKWLFIFINAILFSLAHLFLKSPLVQIITFIGGLLFAFTYLKTRSTILVSIEHALYGCWLFTVGMGEMLAFPGIEG